MISFRGRQGTRFYEMLILVPETSSPPLPVLTGPLTSAWESTASAPFRSLLLEVMGNWPSIQVVLRKALGTSEGVEMVLLPPAVLSSLCIY